MPPDEISGICEQLSSLARSRPNRLARDTVMAGLDSKWEGVQVHAGRALSAWGDAESVAALRAWLERCLQKEAGWSVLGEAVAALTPHVSEAGAAWALDLYFATTDRTARHDLLPLLDPIGPAIRAERARAEASSGIAPRRDAAQVLMRRLRATSDKKP